MSHHMSHRWDTRSILLFIYSICTYYDTDVTLDASRRSPAQMSNLVSVVPSLQYGQSCQARQPRTTIRKIIF